MNIHTQGLRRALFRTDAPSALEFVAAAVLLSLLGLAVFLRHVLHGGFYSDDWGNAAIYEFTGSPRYSSAVAEFSDLLGSRPILAVLLPLPHAVFGVDTTGQLALAFGLGVLTCVSFYLFLRAIPIAPLHAWAIAALTLIFPWADSIRLWATGSLNTIALCFAFLGAFIALRGISATGRRRTASLAVSSALFVMSVLTYEVASLALLLLGALYLGRAPRSTALRWWAVQAGTVLAALVYTSLTTVKEVGNFGERITDIPAYSRHAIAIFSRSLVPPGTTSGPLRAAGVALVLVALGLGVWRWRSSRDPALRFWLTFVAGGVVAVASAYALTLGAHLDPIRPGTFNRGNMFAAFGMVAVLYGTAMVVAQLLRARPRLAAAFVAVSISLVAAGYAVRVSDDIDAWHEAAALQEPVVRRALRAMRDAPPGATVLTFDYPAQVEGGIPIFDSTWDLDGALRVHTAGRIRHAYPIHDRVRLVCGPRAIAISYLEIGDEVFVSYSSTYFVDARTGKAERVASRQECLQAQRRFLPGSWLAPPGFQA